MAMDAEQAKNKLVRSICVLLIVCLLLLCLLGAAVWSEWYASVIVLAVILVPLCCGTVFVTWVICCAEQCFEEGYCGCCDQCCEDEPEVINYTENVPLTSNTGNVPLTSNTENVPLNANASEKIQCYMCVNRIDKMDWRGGHHRKKCFNNNKAEILSFPEPYMAKCRKCEKTLKLWPQRLGSRFTCENQKRGECTLMNSISGKSGEVVADVAVMGNDGKYEIRNTGENRFNCFLCDFDLCKECVVREVGCSDACVAIEMEKDIPTQLEITSFAQPLEVFCSKCGDKLRLWSKKGAAFTCDNMNKMECALMNSSGGCPVGAVSTGDGTWRILNNGSNRFTCFSCSFDLCIQCVLRHLSNPPPSYEATVATSAPSAPAEEDAFVRKEDSTLHVQTID